ncbi:hypothetical protein LTR78_010973 [Recurvomyces mirabilis]|uniref:HhH-GPD domain-containing protein n=1 Tax=Recurvomyces mirabilis TaxID=574656 RepID=A0AAE0TP48_9PEZI|nr:hypothetical protein LTR78_010973 [Recurvomyces mirabilis]KAK5152090.1 hypothetical protein LTS14_008865 [Recurvomyces mirabilis]
MTGDLVSSEVAKMPRRSERISQKAVSMGIRSANPGVRRKSNSTARSHIASRKGLSTRPFPPIHVEHFGIIQSLLCYEPFWLLVAVTLLNKTPGQSARPIFWRIKDRYQDPPSLAAADQDELSQMIRTLGLQTQRSNRIIKLATTWTRSPPRKGVRYRTRNYPLQGQGKELDVQVETDAVECAGALEIGHLAGCGPYAWDSWRIFCRDILRGVADDYNGLHALPEFVPEWKRVRPLDKELQACLRWMWLREGWIWTPGTDSKRRVTEQEMESAVQGGSFAHEL